MKKLYSTMQNEFGFFENEAERKKHEKEITLTIEVGNEKIDLYNFSVIYENDLPNFAYKRKLDDEGKPMVLYWFDDKCSGRFIDLFFAKCKEKGITPIDIISSIKDALNERGSLENARKLKEKK